jgi:DHA2 family multidrug resistance protein
MPPPSDKNRGIITISVMLATVMQALDTTIANVALPRMQGTLSATQDQMTWVLTSYIVASAITIPFTGWLSNRIDRKLVFLASIVGFTVASALCGAAQTLPEIVLFRLLQGVFGAALVPLSQSILFDINPPEKHGSAMAMWGMGVMMGPILGPALGGWLTENYNWRWVFYINVPVGIMAFLGLLTFLPSRKGTGSKSFDFLGFITLSLSVGGFQMFLDRGDLKDWFSSNEVIVEALIAAAAFYLFIAHTLTHERPFINPALFRDSNFVISNILIFAVGIVMFSTLALIPPMLQNLMNYPVVTTGLVTAPRGLGTIVSMFIMGRVSGRTDVRFLMGLGLVLTTVSLWQMTTFSLLMGPWPLVWAGILQGFGFGFVFTPIATTAFSTLPTALRTEGTAFFSLLRNIGSSIGISMVQICLTRNTQTVHAAMAANISPFSPITRANLATEHYDVGTHAGLVSLNQEVTRQAQFIAYVDDYKLVMVTTILMIPLLFLLKNAKQTAPGGHAAVLE